MILRLLCFLLFLIPLLLCQTPIIVDDELFKFIDQDPCYHRFTKEILQACTTQNSNETFFTEV